jgi:hypothetical protein
MVLLALAYSQCGANGAAPCSSFPVDLVATGFLMLGLGFIVGLVFSLVLGVIRKH